MKSSPTFLSSRDADVYAEAIVAATLTLAVIGTEKQNDRKYVVDQYRKVLQVLRNSEGTIG